jgi:hypothetical protein
MGHATRSSDLFCVEASRTTVSQSGYKIGGGATTGGAHGIIADVASSYSLRRMCRCPRGNLCIRP